MEGITLLAYSCSCRFSCISIIHVRMTEEGISTCWWNCCGGKLKEEVTANWIYCSVDMQNLNSWRFKTRVQLLHVYSWYSLEYVQSYLSDLIYIDMMRAIYTSIIRLPVSNMYVHHAHCKCRTITCIMWHRFIPSCFTDHAKYTSIHKFAIKQLGYVVKYSRSIIIIAKCRRFCIMIMIMYQSPHLPSAILFRISHDLSH